MDQRSLVIVVALDLPPRQGQTFGYVSYIIRKMGIGTDSPPVLFYSLLERNFVKRVSRSVCVDANVLGLSVE